MGDMIESLTEINDDNNKKDGALSKPVENDTAQKVVLESEPFKKLMEEVLNPSRENLFLIHNDLNANSSKIKTNPKVSDIQSANTIAAITGNGFVLIHNDIDNLSRILKSGNGKKSQNTESSNYDIDDFSNDLMSGTGKAINGIGRIIEAAGVIATELEAIIPILAGAAAIKLVASAFKDVSDGVAELGKGLGEASKSIMEGASSLTLAYGEAKSQITKSTSEAANLLLEGAGNLHKKWLEDKSEYNNSKLTQKEREYQIEALGEVLRNIDYTSVSKDSRIISSLIELVNTSIESYDIGGKGPDEYQIYEFNEHVVSLLESIVDSSVVSDTTLENSNKEKVISCAITYINSYFSKLAIKGFTGDNESLTDKAKKSLDNKMTKIEGKVASLIEGYIDDVLDASTPGEDDVSEHKGKIVNASVEYITSYFEKLSEKGTDGFTGNVADLGSAAKKKLEKKRASIEASLENTLGEYIETIIQKVEEDDRELSDDYKDVILDSAVGYLTSYFNKLSENPDISSGDSLLEQGWNLVKSVFTADKEQQKLASVSKDAISKVINSLDTSQVVVTPEKKKEINEKILDSSIEYVSEYVKNFNFYDEENNSNISISSLKTSVQNYIEKIRIIVDSKTKSLTIDDIEKDNGSTYSLFKEKLSDAIIDKINVEPVVNITNASCDTIMNVSNEYDAINSNNLNTIVTLLTTLVTKLSEMNSVTNVNNNNNVNVVQNDNNYSLVGNERRMPYMER